MNDHNGGTRLRRGYNPDLPANVQKQLNDLSESCLHRSIAWAVCYLASIYLIAAVAAGSLVAVARSSISLPGAAFVAALVYLLAVILIARQMRGLELMVHDASHGAWDRGNLIRNDWWANALCALPLLMTVAAYRLSHFIHHRLYGAINLDPCRVRFQQMGLSDIDLSTRWKVVKAVLRWLPAYNVEFYREIGSKDLGVWKRFALWHVSFFVLPVTGLLMGIAAWPLYSAIATAAVSWVAFWMLPMITSLPAVRSVAEAEEHDYEGAPESGGEPTEFNTTFTNIGFWHRALFHPWNDEYHVIHHMYPRISQRHHHVVHRILMRHDFEYQHSLRRTEVLAF